MAKVRSHYQHKLDDLRGGIIYMGTQVEEALQHAMKSLKVWNTALASQVIADDQQIDTLQHNLEEDVINIIATQQPVAYDVRLVGSVYAIAAELERMGDYACHIARRTRSLTQQSTIVMPSEDIFKMADMAQGMLRTSLHVFDELDTTRVEHLKQKYSQMNTLEQHVRDAFISLAHQEPHKLTAVLDLLDVTHALQRIAARTINIAERVVYIETSSMDPSE